VVDDETRFMAEASRSEARMVTIARDHQDVDLLGDCLHHLAFDASAQADQCRVWTPETSCSCGE
jgi:hypothetical protein